MQMLQKDLKSILLMQTEVALNSLAGGSFFASTPVPGIPKRNGDRGLRIVFRIAEFIFIP
jgi:hypothetical protein